MGVNLQRHDAICLNYILRIVNVLAVCTMASNIDKKDDGSPKSQGIGLIAQVGSYTYVTI